MEEYIQQLLQDQGVPSDLDPEVRQQLVSQLTGRATDFVNQRLVASMNDEVLAHFETLLDEVPPDPAKVQDFINTNVPDKETIAAQALLEFRAIYLGAQA